jgi:hypothetical protein
MAQPLQRPRGLRADRPVLLGVQEKVVTQDGLVRIVKTQNAEPMFDAIKAAKDLPKNPTMRYVGSIPMILGQKWARECGFAIGTKGWREYAHKKLKSGEFSKLRGE